MTRYGRPEKDVWTAHLPAWRQDAVGRLAVGEVFVILTLDRDSGRYLRAELTAIQARSLAADLLVAADRADRPGPAAGSPGHVLAPRQTRIA